MFLKSKNGEVMLAYFYANGIEFDGEAPLVYGNHETGSDRNRLETAVFHYSRFTSS